MKSLKRSLAHIGPITLLDVGILLALLTLSFAIIAIYISSERFFYYWDWGGFQAVAINYATNILHHPLKTLTQIQNSILAEYNHFYTVPLLPLILIFGKTRLGYVLSVTLAYQIPYSLVIGGIAAQLIPAQRRLVFWSAALLALLTPAALAPTLRAYPDVGAAFLIGLAILVYLQDQALRKWWQIPVIGFLIGAAILFRRHYAYGGIAFFAALTLQALTRIALAFRQDRRQAWRDLWNSAIRIVLAGFMAGLTLFLFGKPFLSSVIKTNYGALFSSYELGSQFVVDYFIANYGWVALALAALGYILGITKGWLSRPAALFLLLFEGLSVLQWTLIVRQISVHYTLHFTLPVVLGLVAFFWVVWSATRGRLRLLIFSGGMAFIVANLVISLTPVHINPKLERWVAYRYPPLYRSDYGEVVRLVEFLRASLPENNLIYVVDSSFRMNFDLLIKAEQVLHKIQRFNVLTTPQIDSRDFYPLELLLKADTVVVSTPPQYHLSNPEEQKVVTVAYEAFNQAWPIAQDFTRLPEQFNLSENVTLNIYRRIRPTSLQTAIQTFTAMRDFLGRRPGGQPDWIILSSTISNPIFKNGDASWVTNLETDQLKQAPGYSLLFADPTPASGRINGTWEYLENPCGEATLGVEEMDANGQLTFDKEIVINPRKKQLPFDLEFQSQGAGYLVYTVKSSPDNAAAACPFQLKWALMK